MIKHVFAVLWILCLGVGCVTERVNDADNGRAYLESEASKIVDRLPYRSGIDLINDCQHLIALGDFAVEPMLECLDHEESLVRCSAAFVLGQLKKQEALDKLRDLTQDMNQQVRLEAARAILEIGAWDSVPMLIEGMEEEELYARNQCFQILFDKTGQTFGYDPEAEEATRMESVKKWRAWWASKNTKPTLAGSLTTP